MDEDDQAGKSAKGRARQTVSDKRKLSGPGAKRKKANMNIRTAILYRKNFATLIEESVGLPFNGSQD
jgi:zinc finger HIT domain-containing protein 1